MAQPIDTGPKLDNSDEKNGSNQSRAERPWYRKKRFLIPLILIVFLIIVSIVNGGGNLSLSWGSWRSSPSPSGPAAPHSAGAPAFPGATPRDVVAVPGQPLDINGMTVTAAALSVNANPEGRALCSAVTYANNTNQPGTFNSITDWKLRNPAGNVMPPGLFGAAPLLASGQLMPGGNVVATVCFPSAVVGEAPGDYVVFYEPSVNSERQRGAWVNHR
jgi:hypothetical protein